MNTKIITGFSALATLSLSPTLAFAASPPQQLTAAPLQEQHQLAVTPHAVVDGEQASVDAYRANINPSASVGTTGPYDLEDEYVGPGGFPLEGWNQIGNPPS
jgi:hypothetical protein